MSFRKENKYRVTTSDYHHLKNILLSNGMKLMHDTRKVNSLYFDNHTLEMHSHSEEGVLPRKKIRIRWYNDVDKFKFEKKISSIEGRFKTTESLKNLNSFDDILTHNPFDNQYGLLLPSLKVSYERTYFSMNGLRITFDKDINYNNLRLNNLINHKDPERVIEIKVPTEISNDFIERLMPHPGARFSKYSRGILISRGEISKV